MVLDLDGRGPRYGQITRALVERPRECTAKLPDESIVGFGQPVDEVDRARRRVAHGRHRPGRRTHEPASLARRPHRRRSSCVSVCSRADRGVCLRQF
jgi:hypothetical protein